MKKIKAFFLILLLMLAFTACSKEEEKKEPDKEEKSQEEIIEDLIEEIDIVENFSEAVEETYKLLGGEIDTELNFEFESDLFDGTVDIAGNSMLGNSRVDLNTDLNIGEANLSMKSVGWYKIVDGEMYLQLDSIVEMFTGADTDFGYFLIPMPDMDETVKTEISAEFSGLLSGLIMAATLDLETQINEEGNEFTIVLESPEQLVAMAKSGVDYLIENKDVINEYYNKNQSSVDVNAYLDEIVEYYRDDIKSAAEALGSEITDEMIDSYVESLYVAEGDKSGDVDYFADVLGVDLDELKTQLENIDIKDVQALIDSMGLYADCTITLDKDKSCVSFELQFEYEGVKVVLSGEVDVNAGVNGGISAPTDVSSITGIVETVSGDTELLLELYTGFVAKMDELGVLDALKNTIK